MDNKKKLDKVGEISDSAKATRKARNRRYYLKHAEQEKERAKRYRKENQEDVKKNNRFYYKRKKLENVTEKTKESTCFCCGRQLSDGHGLQVDGKFWCQKCMEARKRVVNRIDEHMEQFLGV